MKTFVLSLLALILCCPVCANNPQDFYFGFFVLELNETSDQYIAKVRSNADQVTFEASAQGVIVPEYHSSQYPKPLEIGEVNYLGLERGSALFEIILDRNPASLHILNNNTGLIKIQATSTSNAQGSLVYEMERLDITFLDIEENVLLFHVTNFDLRGGTADEFFIHDLLADIKRTAGLMREQMDPPMVTKGKFSGQDLFTAMEHSTYWDVYTFLFYVQEHPYKYQGVQWKISETFATWVDAGAPGASKMSVEETKEKMRELFARESNFVFDFGHDIFAKFFSGVDAEILKSLCSDYRSDIDQALRSKSNAYGAYQAARVIATYLNDTDELGFCAYKEGQIHMAEESFDYAIESFQESLDYFDQSQNIAGKIVASNEMGQAYNQTKDNYRKAIKALENALEWSSPFPKSNAATAPVTAYIYTNLGDSYQGLEKEKTALEMYLTGLTYTDVEGSHALKRKAILLFSLAELYKKMGETSLGEDFEQLALETYQAYEVELIQE